MSLANEVSAIQLYANLRRVREVEMSEASRVLASTFKALDAALEVAGATPCDSVAVGDSGGRERDTKDSGATPQYREEETLKRIDEHIAARDVTARSVREDAASAEGVGHHDAPSFLEVIPMPRVPPRRFVLARKACYELAERLGYKLNLSGDPASAPSIAVFGDSIQSRGTQRTANQMEVGCEHRLARLERRLQAAASLRPASAEYFSAQRTYDLFLSQTRGAQMCHAENPLMPPVGIPFGSRLQFQRENGKTGLASIAALGLRRPTERKSHVDQKVANPRRSSRLLECELRNHMEYFHADPSWDSDAYVKAMAASKSGDKRTPKEARQLTMRPSIVAQCQASIGAAWNYWYTRRVVVAPRMDIRGPATSTNDDETLASSSAEYTAPI
ncbi:hypothetical protein HDG33_003913 [Paraburkholderia sp. Cpub6]|nr:hypothetical protein [Paraburkholderia sp. Cpub6]